jgi:glycosyltransferase involved in cell wall biosynthesis
MFKHKISAVMPAYNEEEVIEKVVKEFKLIPEVTEIVVVDNNSTDRTAELAKKAGAKVVKESRQGYGFACQTALREAKGDIILLTESDGTFEAKDVYKFLSYVDDVDLVLGTRTTRELIGNNAKMGWFLLWGNIALAKLVQLKFRGKTRLTDVGCTFRAIRRDALKKIINNFKIGGSEFSPEMIIVTLKRNMRVIEIPVNYKARVGESKITSNFWRSLKVGLGMLKLILTS